MCYVRTIIIKCALCTFNVLFGLCGLVTIVIGSLVFSGHMGVSNKAVNSEGFAITFIVMGVVLLAESYFGIMAARNESIMLIRLFCVAMVLVCTLQVVANLLLGRGMKDSKIKEQLYKTMDEYNNTRENRKYWDQTQERFKCCGIDGPDDWDYKEFPLPKSCCKKKISGLSKQSEKCKKFGEDFMYIFKKGCQERILAKKAKFLLAIRVESGVLSMIQITSAIFAFWLGLRLKEEYVDENF